MEIIFNVFDKNAEFTGNLLKLSKSDSGDIEFSMGDDVLFLFPLCQHKRFKKAISMIVDESREEDEEITKYLNSLK